MMIEGAIDGEVLKLCLEHFQAPELRVGDMVLWVNVATHKNKEARDLIEQRRAGGTAASILARTRAD